MLWILLFSLFALGGSSDSNISGGETVMDEGRLDTFVRSAPDLQLEGSWIRNARGMTVTLNFRESGVAEIDFQSDGTPEVDTAYRLEDDRIIFSDRTGLTCPEDGAYTVIQTPYYVAFDIDEDLCRGRVEFVAGFWVREDHADTMEELSVRIRRDAGSDLRVERARMYMALGESAAARGDLDIYLETHPRDERALVNRAATRMPSDPEGVVADCSRALERDPEMKNAYFLRGLAHGALGSGVAACKDFQSAIEHGFSVLEQAEGERCAAYWVP